MASLDNLTKPDNSKLKRIADTMLYTLPLVIALIPTLPLVDNTQKWIMFGLSIVIIGFKGLTKFTTNEEPS